MSYSQERCDPRPLEKQRQALKGRATGTMLSEFSLIIFTHQKMLKLFKNPEKNKTNTNVIRTEHAGCTKTPAANLAFCEEINHLILSDSASGIEGQILNIDSSISEA